MRTLTTKRRFGVALLATAILTTAGCTGGSGGESGQQREDESRQSTYERLTETQPAHSMDYSPTRATKNFWVDTWGRKGKVSYVYLMDASADVFGYFVLDGLPVSYCTSLIPPYQIQDYRDRNGGNAFAVPGPSVDGTFSSSSNCSAFYGKDAVTGAYVEYTVGMGINALVFDQPMPQYGDAKPLGPGTIAKAKP